MLAFSYNFLTINCDWYSIDEEVFELRTIDCVHENGNSVDTGFISNKFYYKLDSSLFQESGSFDVHLCVGDIPLNMAVSECCVEFAKYTTNINYVNYENGVILSSKTYDNNAYWKDKQIVHFELGNVFERLYTKMILNLNSQPFSDIDQSAHNPKDFTHESIKTKRIRETKKTLGLSGDKIETTVFKIKFQFTIFNNITSKEINITLETEPFGFSENEEGFLIVNKQVKFKQCLKLLDMGK
ncbi:hypothetical protein CDIK_0702 [Cucumispora dikerogammari]|nr:hypothetical protein CDIK_0702 [Cucumispora dikerogammari]